MNTFDTLEFSYLVIWNDFDLAAWVWAIFSLLFVFVVLGLFWGMMWNRKWGIFGHLASAFLSIFLALVLGSVVLAWFGAARADMWIERQREVISVQLAGSGIINRSAFRLAWESLQPLGGQGNLTPPSEGGNEIRVNNAKEAQILARAAADAVKLPMQMNGPFAFGVRCEFRDPMIVADDVVAAIPSPVYPLLVSPDNVWSKAAIVAQVTFAVESAIKVLSLPLENLKASLVWLGLMVIFIQLVLIPIVATTDIKDNPKH
ncbi:MAG: hypothetical protein WCK17_10505 [Verrucomicrobiota bacterium]